MTDTVASIPTQLRTPGVDTRGSTGRWPTYAIGFGLAAGLTVASFVLAGGGWLTPASLVAALVALAIAQMIVHLVFFLHITTAPAQKTNILALLLTLLIISLVVIGSLWIMAQLSTHMVPMDQLMQMQR
ncbi:cytochrome o ubiquinol oxidase subunit IV [Phenylobacterium sp.]|uniref:cytochrome o ubiquinol oxidase subunit IV n=1 Tax=Phenylobacterium sp. TaxID=1871053 RepID=UPI002E304CBB|nr:cytochrome o ubiquinol oxidase subunit IV [Phenylobacterium sp.]HEX3364175.1 cytochrome o ubiquinol oxidase subunit IV [Phenylobacterium sp.]